MIGPRYIIDGPIRKALDMLRDLQATHPELDEKIRYLASTLVSHKNAFASNIDTIRDTTGNGIDRETKDWIKSTILQPFSYPFSSQINRAATVSSGVRRSTSTSIATTSSTPSSTARTPNRTSKLIETLQSYEFESNEIQDLLMRTFHTVDFDIRHLSDITNGFPLTTLAPFVIIEKENLCRHLNLDPQKVIHFFAAIEKSYRPVPYHNSCHGADVVCVSPAPTMTI